MEEQHKEYGSPRLVKLAHVGETVFGTRWQSPMARSLHEVSPVHGGCVTDRTVRFWVAGHTPVPAWVEDALPKVVSAARGKAMAWLSDIMALDDALRI